MMIVEEVFGIVKRECPERSGGASAGIWGAGERGRQPLYPLLSYVEAQLIQCQQIGRTNGGRLRLPIPEA